MPNWCKNYLIVSGEHDGGDVNDFVHENTAEDGVLSFNESVPCENPNERIDTWGTKWDVFEDGFEVDKTEHCVRFIFFTAWGPPTEWLLGIAPKYPNLEFELEYADPSMELHGYASVTRLGDNEWHLNHINSEPAEWATDEEAQAYLQDMNLDPQSMEEVVGIMTDIKNHVENYEGEYFLFGLYHEIKRELVRRAEDNIIRRRREERHQALAVLGANKMETEPASYAKNMVSYL